MYNTIWIKIASFLIVYATAIECTTEVSSGYEDQWLLYNDENGNHIIMNFSVIPDDTSRIIYGEIIFYLYTRQNAEPEILYPNDEEFISEYFNASSAIKVLTHGWLGNIQNDWVQDIKNELLIMDNLNVILVDWSTMAENIIYPWSAFTTRHVGKKLAELLDVIAETYKLNGRGMHLIGFSLGAHVMAYASNFSNQTIRRITGLDPARPLFELPLMPTQYRLDKHDAEFVDIIHTSKGVYGYRGNHGDVDFYPNGGGPNQPGCNQTFLTACSHGRVNLFFNESINAEKLFISYPCESWEQFENGEIKEGNVIPMGIRATKEDATEAMYCLYTNAEWRYARGSEGNRKPTNDASGN